MQNKMLINGELVTGQGQSLEVLNPTMGTTLMIAH